MSDPTTAWIAKQIRQAREAHGWTQAALAERLERTQTAVSYWESAKRTPGLADLIDLARVLERDIDYFVPLDRARQPVAAVLRAEVARLGSEDLRAVVDDVLELAETAVFPAKTLVIGGRQPAYAANELLERTGLAAPPVPVEALIAACGILLHRTDYPDALSGLIIDAEPGTVIAVNNRHAATRQRFSMAHELGHHLLGHTDRFHLDVSDAGQAGYDYRLERSANEFAADLLMPRRLVSQHFEQAPSTASLAADFEVSEIAMGYRLVNLGLR